MTDTGSQEKPPTDESAEVSVAEAPAPEPMTPRRVSEWNSYYDLYVAIFVVLLVFLGSANKIQTMNSGIFSMLQAGRQTVATGMPVVTDVSSIAGEGRRWVNIPWLFELSHYGLYSAGSSLILPSVPKIPEGTAPEASAIMERDAAEKLAAAEPKAEQFGVGTMIAFDALVKALAAFLLLGLRRKGPGLWWTALCVTMALGVTLGPVTIEVFTTGAGGELVPSLRPWLGVQIGGISTTISVVRPETWGLLFLAIELLLLHQAINLGKASRLYALVPLFLLWANVDDSFAVGLLVLATSVIGLGVDFRKDPSRPSPRTGLIALGLGFAACFVNPSHAFGVLGGFGTILRIFHLDIGPPSLQPISLFSDTFRKSNPEAITRLLSLYYVILVAIGLASFLLNRRNFVLGRFLTFVMVSVFWMLAFSDFTWIFGVVLASTLALNGQEWYQRVFGVEGKLGTGWTIWSTGGRLVTIALIFAAIARGVTGWGSQMGDLQFGFGFNPDDFPFEAATKLKNAPIEGNILNSTLAQGDTIAWKSLSKHKAFIDSRPHLYPRSVFEEFRALRIDLKDDDIAKWQPVLDRFKISVVMIQLIGEQREIAPVTYAKLMRSPNWVPFYDDGAVVMFGRADAKALPSDLAYFQANRLDAENFAYKKPRLVPGWERTPIATWEPLDRIFQNRLLNRPQPHDDASARWLSPADAPIGKPFLATPANCLMAIREARTALSIKPDDSVAFQCLIEAYQRLLLEESALILGIPLTSENITKIQQTPPQSRYLANRTRQLLTSLNFRISTLAPPKGVEDLAVRFRLNLGLAQLYLQLGAVDLAKDRFLLVIDDAHKIGVEDNFLKSLTKQLSEINQQLDQVQKQLDQYTITYRWSPLERANFARANGAPGLAIRELEEANDTGARLPGVLPALIDIYCEVGLPDKAFDSIVDLETDDPKISTGVGTASYRQGLVYLLLGSYENTFNLWNGRSINQILMQRGFQAPVAGQLLLTGDPIAATRTFLELPEKVNTQAQWEFELALAALEGGFPPDLVAEHFENALKLEPNLTVRPVIAYYLEKLGKPVPPPRITTPNPVEPATTPTAEPAPAPPTPSVETPKPAEVIRPDPVKPAEPPKP
jgi:tetratricopeptide (TPR) repeat protein